MIKNIIVTDINGNVTGATYPKRAKGLIKSGRAIKVDESTIRLVSSVYTDAFSYDKEEMRMANIIDFKARGFKLLESCESNRGTRLIVTENDENIECFEIGTAGARTEIVRKVALEKDTDYAFRFAIKSRFVRGEYAESLVSINFDEEDDGYTYPLDRADKNRFKPVICKKTADGLLRVFELPFNSGDATSCSINIRVDGLMAWIYPARGADAYKELEDVDYEQWRQDELHRLEKFINDISGTIGDTINGFGEFVGKAGDKLTKVVSDAIRPTSDKKKDEAGKKAEEAKGSEDAPAEKKEAAGESVSESAPESDGDKAEDTFFTDDTES